MRLSFSSCRSCFCCNLRSKQSVKPFLSAISAINSLKRDLCNPKSLPSTRSEATNVARPPLLCTKLKPDQRAGLAMFALNSSPLNSSHLRNPSEPLFSLFSLRTAPWARIIDRSDRNSYKKAFLSRASGLIAFSRSIRRPSFA